MEIKNLRYFLAVAREENMSKAAEQFVGLENPLSNEHTMEKIHITIIQDPNWSCCYLII